MQPCPKTLGQVFAAEEVRSLQASLQLYGWFSKSQGPFLGLYFRELPIWRLGWLFTVLEPYAPKAPDAKFNLHELEDSKIFISPSLSLLELREAYVGYQVEGFEAWIFLWYTGIGFRGSSPCQAKLPPVSEGGQAWGSWEHGKKREGGETLSISKPCRLVGR